VTDSMAEPVAYRLLQPGQRPVVEERPVAQPVVDFSVGDARPVDESGVGASCRRSARAQYIVLNADHVPNKELNLFIFSFSFFIISK
jgi:hypothetical protein